MQSATRSRCAIRIRREIIVLETHPKERSGWMRREVIDRIRDAAGGLPVEHVVVDLTAEGEANVLVIANETVVGEPLLERIRDRAPRLPASFLIAGCKVSRRDRSTRTRNGGCAARLPSCGGKGSTFTVRLPTRIRTRLSCRPSTTSGSTRSSSRRSQASGRPGCGATWSSACARTRGSRSSTSSECAEEKERV